MARLEHPGKKSYWHLGADARKPSEYAVRSGRLDYYRSARFEVDAPLVQWFERYGAETALDCDWERFDDPMAFTYASYVARRRDDELVVQRLLDSDAPEPQRSATLDELWLALSALRFVYHGLQMASAYVGQMAPASKISICGMFQAGDELRRVQRIAYRLAQLEKAHGPLLGEAGRLAWQSSPAWQGVRALLERLLVSYDWNEAFQATTRVVAPACDALFLEALGQRLAAAGDAKSARLLAALADDSRWHAAWSGALTTLLNASGDKNRSKLEELERLWRTRTREAMALLDSFRRSHG